jgi:hypothetical protein
MSGETLVESSNDRLAVAGSKGDYAGAEGTTYALYSIPRPPENVGANQKCELDHWVSLELGGADDLSNI